MNKSRQTPIRVMKQLKIVRDNGYVNMWDRKAVINKVIDYWSYKWLYKFCWDNKNRNNYGIVLNQFSTWLKNNELQ